MKSYNILFEETYAKYKDQGLVIPRFLNPYVYDTPEAMADKILWEKVKLERISIKNEAILDKEFSKFKAQKNKEMFKIRRANYSFNEEIYFRSTSYMMYLAHAKTQNPERTLKQLVAEGKNWKEKISEIQLANFEKQSTRLKQVFDKQNKQGSLEAIQAKDWLAIKVRYLQKSNYIFF